MTDDVPRPSKVLVVVPTYNERHTIAEVVGRAISVPVHLDVLVVDDGSPDGTGKIAERLASEHPEVHVLHRESKSGLGPAYRAGFHWGLERGYAIFVEMDADLSHDPGQLPELVATAADEADLVIGSRYVPEGGTENWPWHRRALSRGGNRYVQLVTGVPVHDATSGYRAFRRAVLEELGVESLHSDGYSFQLETVLRAWRSGFHLQEVPITFVERRAGASKISRAIVFEALWRVFVWGLKGPRSAGAMHPRSILANGA